MYPPGDFLAVALLEAQRLPTIAIYHNARHIKRKTFLGGGLFSVQLACQLKGKEHSFDEKILFCAPPGWVCGQRGSCGDLFVQHSRGTDFFELFSFDETKTLFDKKQ